jgi:hypothetical protein
MFQKNNFSSYFILTTILIYVLGSNFYIWRGNLNQSYSASTIDFQVAVIGAYFLFCENEFLNTNPYYQVFLISLITSSWCILCIQDYIIYSYNIYICFFGVVWNLLALGIHYKFPNLLVYILRYEIGFSILSILTIYIPFLSFVDDAVVAILAFGFIFISYLNFKRIANLTSTLLFTCMVGNGIIAIGSYIPYEIRKYAYLFDFGFLTDIFLLVGVYYQYKKNNTQEIILGTNQLGNSLISIKS